MNAISLKENYKTFQDLITKQKSQIAMVLPKHINPDRICRILLTEVRKTPKLLECSRESVLGAVMQASQLGLEIGNSLGHAYLIPYKNDGKLECQFMIGYRGMLDLARRSGQIVSLSAQAIFENDAFEFEFGIQQKLKHVPTRSERGAFVGAYAIAHLKDGGYQIEVMFKNDIEKIKSRSKSANLNYSPWKTDYEEMAKKTVIRRLFKYLPISIEFQRAIVLDEAADRGEQDNSSFIEGEFEAGNAPAPKDNVDEFVKQLEQGLENEKN